MTSAKYMLENIIGICNGKKEIIMYHKQYATPLPECSNIITIAIAALWVMCKVLCGPLIALQSTEVPWYLYVGADGSPACTQHFLSVGASL